MRKSIIQDAPIQESVGSGFLVTQLNNDRDMLWWLSWQSNAKLLCQSGNDSQTSPGKTERAERKRGIEKGQDNRIFLDVAHRHWDPLRCSGRRQHDDANWSPIASTHLYLWCQHGMLVPMICYVFLNVDCSKFAGRCLNWILRTIDALNIHRANQLWDTNPVNIFSARERNREHGFFTPIVEGCVDDCQRAGHSCSYRVVRCIYIPLIQSHL